ncbi:MAG TPA: hypothetical protein DCG57_16360 [Candidatus Riflebacteria bacterium]|jgi:hypothetical protein|nr:hypothetical protein [Candidatus Riflebacteria bacterium]
MKQLSRFKREAAGLIQNSQQHERSKPDYSRPSKAVVELIIDTVFMASLCRNEERQPRIKLVYINKHDLSEFTSVARNHFQYFQYAKPETFSAKAVSRISFLIDYKRSFLCVTDADGNTGELTINGIFHLGSEFEKFMALEIRSTTPPPDATFFASNAPGRINIFCGDTPIIGFDKGEIHKENTRLIGNNTICKVFAPFVKALNSDIKKDSKSTYPFTKGEHNDTLNRLLIEFVRKILLHAQEIGHGSAVFFIPSTSETDKILKTMVLATNRIESIPKLSFTIKQYLPLYFRFSLQHDMPDKDKYALQRAFLKHRTVIHDTLDFYASLTKLDGAVIINDRLDLIEYGAEILTPVETNVETSFKLYEKKSGQSKKFIDMRQYGTRHRSAARLVHSIRGAIGFIISQDGGLKLITREKKEVVLYPDIDKLENEFFFGV